MTNTRYVIVEEATGLVDGYYGCPKLAAAKKKGIRFIYSRRPFYRLINRQVESVQMKWKDTERCKC